MRNFSCLILGLWISSSVFAKPIPEIADFTADEINRISEALNTSPTPPSSEEESGWNFRRFILRLQAKVGFTVEIAKVDLVPEIELVWNK